MHQTVEAIYENGILKLLEPLSLREHERVQVTVSKPETTDGNLVDTKFAVFCGKHVQNAPSLDEVRNALAVIPGALTDSFRLARDEE